MNRLISIYAKLLISIVTISNTSNLLAQDKVVVIPLLENSISGYEIIENGQLLSVAPGAIATLGANCPAGKVVLGGGGSSLSPEMHIRTSQPATPDPDPQGNQFYHWYISWQNTSNTSLDARLIAHAICARVQ